MAQPTRLVWRSDLGWSSRSPAGYADPKRGLVIHYDSSNQRLADKPHSACIAYWQWCRRFHTRTRGWDDIGYSWMACVHGYVMEGRGLHRQQAAQPGGNATYYSCTLACGPTDEITAAQIEAVRELRAWLMEPDTSIAGTVLGHRDFNSTSCPGDTAYRMVREGVFSRPPGGSIDLPNNGGASEGDDDMIGLGIGDEGEEVKALQLLIIRAGFGDALGEWGADGKYYEATAEALRQARESVGSRALDGYGNNVTAYAYDQLKAAVIRAEFRQLVKELNLGSGAPSGSPVEIPQDLTVRSLTADTITTATLTSGG